MGWLYPVIRFGFGYALPPNQPLAEEWQSRLFWGGILLGIGTQPVVGAVETGIVRGAPWLARTAWAGANVFRLGSPLAGGGRALISIELGAGAGGMGLGAFGASVLAGYAIGATAGTIIGYSMYGKKGAQDAMDFYMNPFDTSKWQTIGKGLAWQFKNYRWDLGPNPRIHGPLV